MDLEYTVTENVRRNRAGQIVQIDYLLEESMTIEAPSSSSSLTRHNREKRNRTYDVVITREQYEAVSRQFSNPLAFDEFVKVLRPFIMGYYTNDELERAFLALDRDRSGSIHLRELSSFLPILNDSINDSALHSYVQKVDENFDGNMSYDEFRALVLRGIGRDIICNHL